MAALRHCVKETAHILIVAYILFSFLTWNLSKLRFLCSLFPEQQYKYEPCTYYPFFPLELLFPPSPFPYFKTSWISKLRDVLFSLSGCFVYLLCQYWVVIGVWHHVHCCLSKMGCVSFQMICDSSPANKFSLLISQCHLEQRKLKVVELRTKQAFIPVLLPSLEYAYTVNKLFFAFRKLSLYWISLISV